MKNLRLSVLAICALLWLNVSGKYIGKSKRSILIVNGDEVRPHSLPYVVGIRTEINDRPVLCGASLLTPSLVLTAAKCIDGASEAAVILGAHNLNEEEDTQIRLTSSEFIIYPNYNRTTLIHNLALIKLPSAVTLNENINTIGIPDLGDSSANYTDLLGQVAGWGKTSDLSPAYSSVLRKLEVTVIPNILCDLAFFFTIQSNQICTTGTERKDICLGDSGSPLVIDGVQVGIASFGSDYGCEAGFPGVYTRLSKYLPWLTRNIEANS